MSELSELWIQFKWQGRGETYVVGAKLSRGSKMGSIENSS